MNLCTSAIAQLSEHLLRGSVCRPSEAGYEVLSTPFLYPDRDNVELFLKIASDGKLVVSDLGQTIMKLSEYGFQPETSPRRRGMIFQIVSSLNVRYENGSLVVVADETNFGTRTWDLLMAVQRLSDLVFTVQSYTRATFGDEFENYVVERKLAYERGVQIELPGGYRFTADFLIKGEKVVQLLSASSAGYARERVDRVYVNFSELSRAQDKRQRLAVIDTRQPVWDLRLIDLLSHQADSIFEWPKRGDLERALAA